MHCFLQEEKIRQHVTPLEIMASLIGAVAHDLDHPGVNQHFLISTSNHLAILYQNMSVLENHHWRSAIGCLLESGVAEQLQPVRGELEKQIRDLILATDINRQPEFLSRFRKHLDEGSLDLRQPEHRNFILQIALKCADISNPTRPWDISHKWSLKVCDEFFRQGEYERKLNLPVTSICDQQSTSVAKIQVDSTKCDQQSTSLAKTQVGFYKFMVTPLFVEWHRFLGSPLSTHMMKVLDENRRRWMDQEKQEQAEETQTELSDADAEEREEEERQEGQGTGLVVTGQPTARDFMPSPPKEIRRQSLAVPTLESLGVRRHSVPVNIEQSLPRTIYSRQVDTQRRESLPTGRGTAFARSPVSPQTESRASSGLREEDELLRYGSQSSDVSSSSPHHSSDVFYSAAEEGPGGEDERPLSAENLLPEPSIASMTAEQTAVCRLAEVLQGTSPTTSLGAGSVGSGQAKSLTRQQTFPPPQPYVRMRYMSATAEMSACREVDREEDSKSNSSHGSCDNISSSNGNNRGGPSSSAVHPPIYPIPSIAVLSPNNGRPPELLLGGVPAAPVPPTSGAPAPPTVVIQKPPGNKREPDTGGGADKAVKMVKLSDPSGQRYQKENVDPRKLPTTSLSRRRGSAPVSLPLSKPADEKMLPAGGGLIPPSDTQSLRRGSVPIEIAHSHYYPIDDEEPLLTITPVETSRSFWQQQRRGSAPVDLPPPGAAPDAVGGGLTRHTSSCAGAALATSNTSSSCCTAARRERSCWPGCCCTGTGRCAKTTDKGTRRCWYGAGDPYPSRCSLLATLCFDGYP
ncbi:unnamed protein product [Callosobruchus maculatus]|uniref:Phosphodiesterase n=1 Tax=Callosobruchus maculatus TaxID=64391 RepID=A0A653BVU5_CALMS|nr:unnamed protein product [Callosobruchus maculatus]